MEPALKPAVETTGTGRVGVVATAATFQGELFASVVDRFATGVEVVTAACPRWVELVEEDAVSGREARREVEGCLAPMVDAGIDVLVLACTHYPALTGLIAEVLGPDVQIIDPAPAVARQTARVAAESLAANGAGTTQLFTTGDLARLQRAVDRAGIDGPVSLLPLV
jgi:glutamate racemase